MKKTVIVGNEKYGLYLGETDMSDEEIDRVVSTTHSIRLSNVRHVARWHGKTGGITSLAAFGPCGPNASQSRVGSPSPSSLLTGVVNIFECTESAVLAFARIEPNDG